MAVTSSERIDVGELIDGGPLGRQQIFVIGLCALVILLDGYDIQTMALAVPALTAEWGVQPTAFSYALTASVFGMLVATALIAPFGDRLGRRPVLIAGMVLIGVTSIATGLANTPSELVVWRFLTGIGLGMCMPNATALTSEYVPLRTRAFLITAMYVSIALGALLAGFVAPPLIDAFGWRSIFFVGGALPLAVAVLLIAYVPESIRLLVAQRPGDPRIPAILARFLPGVDATRVFARPEDRIARQGVRTLFAPAFRARTALLWTVFALNLFVLFVLISWLPTVLSGAGWTQAQALRGAVMIQAGGIVGGLVIARFVDRAMTVRSLGGAYLIVAVALALFLVVPPTVANWTVLLLIVGAGVSGTQAALTALSAIFYPPSLRATGAGWASTCGRAGAVVAPLAGGVVLAGFSFEPAEQLALLIPAVLLCGACVMLLPYAWDERGAR